MPFSIWRAVDGRPQPEICQDLHPPLFTQKLRNCYNFLTFSRNLLQFYYKIVTFLLKIVTKSLNFRELASTRAAKIPHMGKNCVIRALARVIRGRETAATCTKYGHEVLYARFFNYFPYIRPGFQQKCAKCGRVFQKYRLYTVSCISFSSKIAHLDRVINLFLDTPIGLYTVFCIQNA